MTERRILTRRLRAKVYRGVVVHGPDWAVCIDDNADGRRRLAHLEGSFPDVLRQVAALPRRT
jgi:hypothetical protein